MPESLGRRLAAHRARLGLTQHELAERLALSRNAVSHLETGLSLPSERTVILLAGLFAVEPHELVAGTEYPPGKADRLPVVAPRHTDVEARLAALALELRWVDQLAAGAAADALTALDAELAALSARALHPAEQRAVRAARSELAARRARAAPGAPA
ncbi:MAG TPA: helix-turn-helix transcriptional regulator [Acidimicrobiales bacterium]|nr:helix-turn-helix transcriptional regulator [Acidimicrobiales bacterium]